MSYDNYEDLRGSLDKQLSLKRMISTAEPWAKKRVTMLLFFYLQFDFKQAKQKFCT